MLIPDNSRHQRQKVFAEYKEILHYKMIEPLLLDVITTPLDLLTSGLVQLERLKLNEKFESINVLFSDLENLDLESLIGLKSELSVIIEQIQERIILIDSTGVFRNLRSKPIKVILTQLLEAMQMIDTRIDDKIYLKNSMRNPIKKIIERIKQSRNSKY